ncbi:MAG TPA: PP2C family protein-serine/threonine phosphatase [Acidobacteriaceae bacterium]|nr:PP2C family protein-serine/threonine phosphatase [Acidobacteriaceae bacterium]
MISTPPVVRRSLSKLVRQSPLGRGARMAEKNEARALHAQLLPRAAPQVPGYDLAFAFETAAACGGDLFDVFALEDGTLALCIADVSGKGMEAVRLTSDLRAAVRACAPEAQTPAQLCTTVNRLLSGKFPPGKYATMFYGMLDVPTGTLRYESAGHCLPVLIRADGSVEFPASFSGVLGLFSHWLYQDQEVRLRSGDTLLLVTDGVLGAEARRGGEFGYQRVIAAVQNAGASSAAELGSAVLEQVSQFCRGRLRDDASLIVLKAC